MFNFFGSKKKIEHNKYKELSNLNNKLMILLETNKAIAKLENLDMTLDEIFDGIEKSLGYKSSLLTVNNNTRRLEAYNVSPIAQSLVKVFLRSNNVLSVPLDYANESEVGLAVKAAITGEVQLTNSMYEVVKPLVPRLTADIIQSTIFVKYGIVVPIKIKDKVIAVLTAGSRVIITSEDIKLLSFFADLAGLAINNSQIYENTVNQKKHLEISEHVQRMVFKITNELITTLDPKVVAKRTVDYIPKETGFFGAILTLVDEEEKILRAVAVTETVFESKIKEILQKDYPDFPSYLDQPDKYNQDIIKAFKEDKITISKDLEEAFSPGLPVAIAKTVQHLLGVKSIVSLPIKSREKIIGVISFVLLDKFPKELNDDDIGLMKVIANQIGIALDNAVLHNRIEDYSKQLKEIAQQQEDIIDVMGHELRTPLTAIVQEMNIQKKLVIPHYEGLLESNISKSESSKLLKLIFESFDTIDKASLHAVALTNEMLEAARIDKHKVEVNYEKFNIIEVVKSDISILSKTIDSKNCVINLNLGNDLVSTNSLEVESDKIRINESLYNLINNAIKYRDILKDKSIINVSIESKNNTIRIKVMDNGIGIRKEDIPKLGQKFLRLNPKTEGDLARPGGTGLGLYATKGIIELLKGKLIIESDGPDKGSTFTLEFPRYKAD